MFVVEFYLALSGVKIKDGAEGIRRDLDYVISAGCKRDREVRVLGRRKVVRIRSSLWTQIDTVARN